MNHMEVIFFPHEKVLFDVDFHFQCMSHGMLKGFQKKFYPFSTVLVFPSQMGNSCSLPRRLSLRK